MAEGLLAGLAAAACLAVAGFAPGIVNRLLALPVRVFPGAAPPSHYAALLQSTALSWAVLLPIAVLVYASVPRRAGRFHRGVATGLTPSVATLLVALVVTGAALVPRQRTGDEPAYLIMAQSLVRDGDLQAPEAGKELHPSTQARPGVVVSKHPPGLAFLIAFPRELAGEIGLRAVLAATAVGLVALLIRLLVPWLGTEGASLTGLLLGISFPIAPYASLVFPDLPAALCVALLTAHLSGVYETPVAPALAMAFLPWLNPRMLPPAVLFLAWSWLDRKAGRRSRAGLTVALVGSLAIMAWVHLRWFGSPSPFAARWGEGHLFSLSDLLPGLLGVLVDQQYGLLVWAPVFVLLPVGLAVLWRRSRGTAVGLLLLAGATCMPGILHVWTAGWSPAARYLVPALPFLAIPVGLGLIEGLHARGWRYRFTQLVVVAQLAIGLLSVMIPGKLFGTLESAPRNYYFDLAGRLLHFDPSVLVPTLLHGPPWRSQLHAGLLVLLWMAISWLWVRRAPETV